VLPTLALLALSLAAPGPGPAADVSRPRPIDARDVAPVLVGEAAAAPAALAEGRHADALRALARARGPEASLLRARALFHLARHEEALAALEGVEGALGEIADRVLFLRAKVLAARGRHADAATQWGKVPPGSVLAEAAAVARGRALAAAGEEAKALEVLVPIGARPAPVDLSQPDPAATALAAAGPLLARRDPAAARAALLSCWGGHPIAPEADGCLAALRRLPGEAGRAPGDAQEVDRAERLLEANRNRSAIAGLERVLARVGEAGPEAPLACRARAAAGRAHRKERQHARAIELLRPVVASCSDPAVRLRALFVLAGSVAISGDREEALGLYRRLAEEHPESALADDALVSAADLLERLGRPEEALALFAAAASGGPDRDKRPEALFRSAWAARRTGDDAQAEARFLAIEAEFRDRDPYEHARAAYWRARVLAAKGPEGAKAAAAVWTDLVRRYPVDWYGLLSRARLAQAGGSPGDALPAPLGGPVDAGFSFDPGPLRSEPRLAAALRLLRIGLGEEAAEELRAIDLTALRAASAGSEPVFGVAALLDLAGDHRSAHAILKTEGRAVLRAPPAGDTVRLWRIAYPPAFREEVVRFATASSVPPDLLQALMREESALDPSVISQAGAIGLTQLMPSTAAAVAKRLGIGSISASSLTDPATNIRIGAAYLGELLARYGRQPALALAAYNAGAGAVRRWLDARGALELDEFVEEIPIDETRGYVKRVLRTFAAYRLLSTGAAREPLDLLPRTLRGGAHSEAISPPRPGGGTRFGLSPRSD
jgi:soluble lytic murein transglycosylase